MREKIQPNIPCRPRQAGDIRGTVQDPGFKQGFHHARIAHHGSETPARARDGDHWHLKETRENQKKQRRCV